MEKHKDHRIQFGNSHDNILSERLVQTLKATKSSVIAHKTSKFRWKHLANLPKFKTFDILPIQKLELKRQFSRKPPKAWCFVEEKHTWHFKRLRIVYCGHIFRQHEAIHGCPSLDYLAFHRSTEPISSRILFVQSAASQKILFHPATIFALYCN